MYTAVAVSDRPGLKSGYSPKSWVLVLSV